ISRPRSTSHTPRALVAAHPYRFNRFVEARSGTSQPRMGNVDIGVGPGTLELFAYRCRVVRAPLPFETLGESEQRKPVVWNPFEVLAEGALRVRGTPGIEEHGPEHRARRSVPR